MAVSRPLVALQATVGSTQSRTIRCHTSEKLVQMCTVKIGSGLGYKSSQIPVQVQVHNNGLKSGL